MKSENGYFKIATIRSVPLLVHWSLPAVGLLALIAGEIRPVHWVSYFVSFVLLVVIHESGHLFAAVFFGLKIYSVRISVIGGLCHFERPRNVRQSVLVYSAGFLAQAAAFLLTLANIWGFGVPHDPFGRSLVFTFTFINVVFLVANLIPQQGKRSGVETDGRVLRRLYLHAYKGHPHPHPPLVITPADEAPILPPETRLLETPGFRPAGFKHGVEILSDRTTSMDFVVKCLMTHLGMTKALASVTTFDIHNTGGILISLPSEYEARAAAVAVAADSSSSGQLLVCRYAGVGESCRTIAITSETCRAGESAA
jgi:ATP-dependent Clp protease adapter protein ClpS